MARERDERGRFKRGNPVAHQVAPPRAKRRKKDKYAIFFRELSMFCNVSSALRKAGLASQSSKIYERRLTDPGFRARWAAAIEQSVELLDLEILERGRFGDDRPPPKSEVERRLREVPTALALQLLKHHQGRAKLRGAAPAPVAAPPRMTRSRAREIRIELEAMLDDFNRRMGGEG